MDDAFLGEIRPFANNFAPYGWLQCNGQTLPIQQYAALFSLLGTYYGGNGQTNFMLPNLNGKVAVGQGTLTGGDTYDIGETGGVASVALTINETPNHTHAFNGAIGNPNTLTSANVTPNPAPTAFLANGFLRNGSTTTASLLYSHTAANTAMAPGSIIPAGLNQAHSNMAPYLAINYCICMQGVFPQRP